MRHGRGCHRAASVPGTGFEPCLLLLDGRKGLRIRRVRALRLAEPSRALSVGIDVVDDVVGALVVAGHAADSCQVIVIQILSGEPGNHVVRAGGISPQAHGADQFLTGSVKAQTASPGDGWMGSGPASVST